MIGAELRPVACEVVCEAARPVPRAGIIRSKGVGQAVSALPCYQWSVAWRALAGWGKRLDGFLTESTLTGAPNHQSQENTHDPSHVEQHSAQAIVGPPRVVIRPGHL